MDTRLRATCWVYNNNPLDVFRVIVSSTGFVAELKCAIKEKIRRDDDVSARDLGLYIIPIPETWEDLKATLKQWTFGDRSPLVLGDKLSDLNLDRSLVVVQSPLLTLNCWVYGQDRGTFTVKVSTTRSVKALKAVIQNTPASNLRNIPLDRLDLYRISIPHDVLEAFAKTMNFGNSLSELERLSLVFCDHPPGLNSESYVHIMIIIRPLEEPEISFQDIKHLRLGKMAPSHMDILNCLQLQSDCNERLLDRRFSDDSCNTHLPDNDIPPIALVYQPFGQFLDTYLSERGYNPEEALSPRARECVDRFMARMASIYASEDARQGACLQTLNDIFYAVLGERHRQIMPGVIGKFRSDGHSRGPHGTPLCVVEFKNESPSHYLPVVELACYYHQLATEVKKRYKSTFMCSTLPALGMTITGPGITFYALVSLPRCHYAPLSHALSCIDSAVGENTRLGIYRAFAAAAALLDHISQHVISISAAPSPQIKNRLLPVITSLPAINQSSPLEFKITGRLITSLHRQLYVGTSMDGRTLVIKFVRTYSPELHMHSAEKGHAPPLRGFGKLQGNFFGVAMDFMGGARNLDSNGTLSDQEHWAHQLTELVRSFHDKGFVHGDLRYPNILHVKNKIILLDYDWGGKEGEAMYPFGSLHPDLTEGRTRTDLKITKEDDQRILATTLTRIQESYSMMM